ncbi:MAG TPA: ABC transporter ATP-binding protein [Bacillota bacterium]|nr:ABC transporter ATP-binding protein [Bacillota bacterium]
MSEKSPSKKKLGFVGVVKRLVPIVVRATPVFFISFSVLAILHGVSWGFETMMQQRFFDAATVFAQGESTIRSVLVALAFLGGANILCQVLNGVVNFVPEVLGQKVIGRLSKGIHEKMARLDPKCFEDTDVLDDINKALQGQNNALWFVFMLCAIFTFYVPYFIFMGWYLFTLKPILVISIVIIFIPAFLTQIVRTKVFAKLEDKSAPKRREFDYYESCIVSREYFKETRLLGGYKYFKKLYLDTLDTLQKLKFQAMLKTNLLELLMSFLTVLGFSTIFLMLFDAVMKGEITVGAFAAVTNSIGLLYSIMEEVVCRHAGQIAQSMGSITNYLNFLDLEERQGKVQEVPQLGDVVLEGVSFKYPGSEKYAVKDVSFTLKHGETLAIVGENGSGKSTLIRLLTGIYLPDEGRVTIGGVDTRDLSLDALYRNTSAVFQKYQRYLMTLEDNITISDAKKTFDDLALDDACRKAGVDSNGRSFPEGYKTMLSREFDGVDLSGGQWQRVAIARGFFRDHQLIILDEPTAAIDPYEETRVYNRFAEISKDKTAVIVTHRLGSVKLADRIVVLKDGKVVQVGTHDELIARSGEYHRLYKSQEKWYIEDAEKKKMTEKLADSSNLQPSFA